MAVTAVTSEARFIRLVTRHELAEPELSLTRAVGGHPLVRVNNARPSLRINSENAAIQMNPETIKSGK